MIIAISIISNFAAHRGARSSVPHSRGSPRRLLPHLRPGLVFTVLMMAMLKIMTFLMVMILMVMIMTHFLRYDEDLFSTFDQFDFLDNDYMCSDFTPIKMKTSFLSNY